MSILPFQGFTPRIASSAFIASNSMIIGKTRISVNSNVWFGCVIRGDGPGVSIGRDSNIQDGTIIHTTTPDGPTSIGNRVTVGHLCLLHACSLMDDSFVGMGSLLLDNSVMQPFSMLAAGSLLTPGTIVPTGELWAGRPAKKMRMLKDSDYAMFEFTWKHYVHLGQSYLGEDSIHHPRVYQPTKEEIEAWNSQSTD